MPSPRHMLAMKACAGRASDVSDMKLLLLATGIDSTAAVDDVVSSVFGGVRLTPAQRSCVDDVVAETRLASPKPESADSTPSPDLSY